MTARTAYSPTVDALPVTTAAHGQRARPTVSIVVVNYNGRAHLDECFASLRAQTYPNVELIVVDNASSDGSLELLRRHDDVTLIPSAENLGYAGAVNLAATRASGTYIAVLNMDVVVEPDWLEPLVAFLETHPQAGAVTPKVLLYERRDRINALGQNVHVTGLGFNRRLHYPDAPGAGAPEVVSGIHGAAFVMRRALFATIGGMNATNFMYHEDVDISWMVTLAGYDLYCVPGSVIYHKYDLTMNPWKLYYLERNRWALLLASLRPRTLLLLLPLLLLTELMMLAFCLRRGRAFLAAKGRAIRWNWDRRRVIQARREQIGRMRRRSDRQLLARLRFNYDWDQLLHLARERLDC